MCSAKRSPFLLPTDTRIDDDELPHAINAVIAGENREQAVVRAGNRTWEEQRVGIPRVASVDGPLSGAVGIHRHQLPEENVADARVVPAMIDDLTRWKHGRMEVVVLVEAELANVRAIAVHQVEIAYSLATVPARHGLIGGRRSEDDLAAGQVARVHVAEAAP